VIAFDASLRERVCAFYAYETMLFDDGRLREWLDLLTDDVRYVAPMRESRLGQPPATDAPTFMLFDDDRNSLMLRVARLETGMALVELPPSATQRLVTDVHILSRDNNEVFVRSSFLVLQVRDEMNETLFAGRRTDRLVLSDDAIKIRRRDILLAHFVLPRTISMLF
jgi:3-phenylpropionate/cinnamic acid dioxygenase small subunit